MSPIGTASAHTALARRSPLVVLAAVTALTAAACGQAPTGTLNTRAGYTIDAADVPVSICPGEDESRLAEADGTLIGPHFALRVECVASFEEIPDGFQLEYLFGEDAELFPPEPGYEFTIVQFAPDPGVEAPFPVKSDTQLRAALAIGDETWEFDGEVPAPGSVYFAVAEQGAPITLEVDDAERAQTMDLRERTKEGVIEALYHGSRQTITTDEIENTVTAYLSSGGYEYSLDGSVYNETDGWIAEPDRALLTVEFAWFRESKENELIWDIDPKKALKVSGPDGAMTATGVEHEDEVHDDDLVIRYYTLSYDVAADALAFDLAFHPTGKIEWTEHGVKMPISGDKKHELSVDFS